MQIQYASAAQAVSLMVQNPHICAVSIDKLYVAEFRANHIQLHMPTAPPAERQSAWTTDEFLDAWRGTLWSTHIIKGDSIEAALLSTTHNPELPNS